MKDQSVTAYWLASVCLGLSVSTAAAQEALRSSIAGEEASAQRRRALEDQPANLKLGPASLLIGASMSLELNDNVNYSDQLRQNDLIFRPALNVIAAVPLTDENALFGTLDLGYAKYLRYSQYDRLLIAPGTQLGLDMYVKDFHFNVHDDIAVTDVPVAQGTISGAGNYGEFSNTAGLTADWDLNKVIATVGFDHQNSIATVSSFSYLNRRSENFFGRAAYEFSSSLTGGPEASAGFTAYDQHVLSDSLNYSFGAFANWQLSSHISIHPRAGFTAFVFSQGANGQVTPNSSSYYMSLEMSHKLNDFVSYAVDAGRQIRLGINSELIDLWYAHPRIEWRVIDQVGLGTHLAFENGTDSGTSLLVASERYTLLGGGINVTYRLMEKLLVGLDYDYTVKSSNISERNYHQNKIQLRFQYTF